MTTEQQQQGAAEFIERMRNRHPSLSGPGSTLEQTREVREWLPRMMRERGIRRLVDVPCGDWCWMQQTDLSGVEYIGLDLSQELIDSNRQRFAGHEFRRANAITDELPDADLVLSRDFFVHLTYEHAAAVIANARRHARYLAATTFPGIVNRELGEWWPGWGWRPLDMEQPPFGLRMVDAVTDGHFAEYPTRSLGLFLLGD